MTRATRYITPLREGGSLPGLVEAEDLGTWVVKFSGAGQGPGALIAELVAGELGRSIGLPVPELSLIEVPVELGRAEPDPEVKDLIEASRGLNLAMDFLPGALPFTLSPDEPGQPGSSDPELAAAIYLFDGLVTNIDRTPRNPNLLIWHGRTWMIDHGAAFFRQHGNSSLAETATLETPALRDHVLIPVIDRPALRQAADRIAGPALEAVPEVVDLIPDEWLEPAGRARGRDIGEFLRRRLDSIDLVVEELSGYLDGGTGSPPDETGEVEHG
ncbi:MAG: aminotransferase class I and II [Solirubrobacterales bacterium]|nr:aminotransferase class I and II [Solirubrobacterales bacterium]